MGTKQVCTILTLPDTKQGQQSIRFNALLLCTQIINYDRKQFSKIWSG